MQRMVKQNGRAKSSHATDHRAWCRTRACLPIIGTSGADPKAIPMGYLTYDSVRLDLRVEDRVLAHLHIVIINKLRRGESFPFSWKDPTEVGDGRSSIWLYPTVPLHFKFSGSRQPQINKSWLEVLYRAAESGQGLRVLDEPVEQADSVLSDGDSHILG